MRQTILFIPLLLVACATPAAVEAPSTSAGAGDEPTLVVRGDLVDGFTYNPIGKRDPFRSWLSSTPFGDDDDLVLHPLQEFELDQLCVTGIAVGLEPLALITTPDGTGWPARVGDLVGRSWGRIGAITSARVEVVEEWRDPIENRLLRSEVSMELGGCTPDDAPSTY